MSEKRALTRGQSSVNDVAEGRSSDGDDDKASPQRLDDDAGDLLLTALKDRLDAMLARPPVPFSAEAQKRIEEARSRATSRAEQDKKSPSDRILVRSAWVRRRSLADALVLLLKRDGCLAPEKKVHRIVLALEEAAGAAHAGGCWQQNRYTSELRHAFKENSIRTALFSDYFNTHRRKIGMEGAALQASKFWQSTLTRAQLGKRVRFTVPPWEVVVGDALIHELAKILGRKLRFSVAAKDGRFAGPDLRVLREAMALARSMPGAPKEKLRGKRVQALGSEHWFANRLRLRAKAARLGLEKP